MKKFLLNILVFSMALLLFGCGKTNKSDKEFMKLVTATKGYKVEGVMETNYENGKKQNDFLVYYKNPDLIKVVIKTTGTADKQIILKNSNGVYILVPAVNRNFKIQSSWPNNASYPYLLQSLAKDIANDAELIKTVENDKVTIETKTKMHANANPTKQKIIFDSKTSLPKEVIVYDSKGDIHIRIIFTNIELDYNVNDVEFDLNKSMETVRLEFGAEKIVYKDRAISYPGYYPHGAKLAAEDTIVIGENNDVRSIMKFTGDVGFTVIQEFVNDSEEVVTINLIGDIVFVFGTAGVIQEKSLHFIYGGIEYVLASNDLTVDDMVKIASSYLVPKEK